MTRPARRPAGRSRRHRGGEPAAARNGEPPPTAPLELMNVTRRFGGISAVEDVTLRVADREIVGLIGQNGAGKTTIFDLICGYQPLDGGRILLGGVDVSSWSPTARARSGLGRTFQGGQLFPGLTVTDSIAVSLDRSLDARDPFNAAFRLPARTSTASCRCHARVEELLGLFGIEDYRDCFTAELSTGTRRIVELACAVGHQPRCAAARRARRPGSPNARSRRCRPCCGGFATTWAARSWSSNTTCH